MLFSWGTNEFYVANEIVKGYELAAVESSPLFSDVIPALQLAASTVKRVCMYISSMQSIDVPHRFVWKHAIENYLR